MTRDLVEQAMAGDHDAFSELTRAQIAQLYGLARMILRDGDRAQDAVQEALVSAWRHLSALRDADRFDAWLRRSVVRACYREAKKERRYRSLAAEVKSMEPSIADPAVAAADRDEVARLFDGLEPEQRALLVLHYKLGLPMAETSAILGIPIGTVKSRLNRTLKQMRATADADARTTLTAGVQPS